MADKAGGAGSTENGFNPKNPDGFNIEAKLLLVPGALIAFLVIFLIYRLLHGKSEKQRLKEEKKKLKAEKKKK